MTFRRAHSFLRPSGDRRNLFESQLKCAILESRRTYWDIFAVRFVVSHIQKLLIVQCLAEKWMFTLNVVMTHLFQKRKTISCKQIHRKGTMFFLTNYLKGQKRAFPCSSSWKGSSFRLRRERTIGVRSEDCLLHLAGDRVRAHAEDVRAMVAAHLHRSLLWSDFCADPYVGVRAQGPLRRNVSGKSSSYPNFFEWFFLLLFLHLARVVQRQDAHCAAHSQWSDPAGASQAIHLPALVKLATKETGRLERWLGS